MPDHILLGTCLYLLGANLAIDTYGGLPFYNNGYDCSAGCSLSHMGGPIEYATGQCYLPVLYDDPYYATYLDLWCHDVIISSTNGPVTVKTPCASDPNLVTSEDAPYAIRVYWAQWNCPPAFQARGMCTVENVCTAADKLHGDCTCTVDEQDAGSCTPGDAGVDGGAP